MPCCNSLSIYPAAAAAAAAAAKSLQSCPTLCDPIDGSPPGFPVPGQLACPWSLSTEQEDTEFNSRPCGYKGSRRRDSPA